MRKAVQACKWEGEVSWGAGGAWELGRWRAGEGGDRQDIICEYAWMYDASCMYVRLSVCEYSMYVGWMCVMRTCKEACGADGDDTVWRIHAGTLEVPRGTWIVRVSSRRGEGFTHASYFAILQDRG